MLGGSEWGSLEAEADADAAEGAPDFDMVSDQKNVGGGSLGGSPFFFFCSNGLCLFVG